MFNCESAGAGPQGKQGSDGEGVLTLDIHYHGDEELDTIIKGTIAGGGVIPHI